MDRDVRTVLHRCREHLPEWRPIPDDQFEWDPPKGFSSFTMTVRAPDGVNPAAVLYRELDGKDNAILDPLSERRVFRQLSDERLAPALHAYEDDYRIEAFYDGRTLTPADLRDPGVLAGIAGELHRFHRLPAGDLPADGFFELLHEKWSRLGRRVLIDRRDEFPADEQALCEDLLELYRPETLDMVRAFIPDGPTVFCHNDTYHGNAMLLDTGDIKLLDFEFSCRNHPAFDFANLFAETMMQHGFIDPPHVRIGEPTFTRDDIATLVASYLDLDDLSPADRQMRLDRLVSETEQMIPLSHFMYAMAAIPLAADPIQKIRFLPYAHMRWTRFKELYAAATG